MSTDIPKDCPACERGHLWVTCDACGEMLHVTPTRDDLKAENARLREALQMAVDTIAHNGPDGVSMAAALGIRPSIRHKETP